MRAMRGLSIASGEMNDRSSHFVFGLNSISEPSSLTRMPTETASMMSCLCRRSADNTANAARRWPSGKSARRASIGMPGAQT
jgi:hypothetical protein